MTLGSCASNATIQQQSVFIIYLDPSPNDPNGEVAMDLQLLASGATAQGFPGTPYMGTLTQYYSSEAEAGTPPACDDGGIVPIQNVELAPSGSTCGSWTYVNADCDATYGTGMQTILNTVVSNCNIPNSTTLVVQFGPDMSACSPICGVNNNSWFGEYNAIQVSYFTQSNLEEGGAQWGCGSDWKMALTTALNHEYAESTASQWCVCANCNGGEAQIADLCEMNYDSSWASLGVQVIPSGNQPQPCSAADASASHCWPDTVQIQPLWSNEADASGGPGACVYSYETESTVFINTEEGDGSFSGVVSQSDNSYLSYWWAYPAPAFHYNLATTTSGPYHINVLGYTSTSDLMEANQIGTPTSGWGSTGTWDWGGPRSGYSYKVTTADGFPSAPAVTSWGAGRYDLFATADNGSIREVEYRSWDNYTDSGWSSLGKPSSAGAISSGPGAVAAFYKRLDVFILMGDGNVYQNTSSDGGNTWGGWASIGAPSGVTLQASPAAAAWGAVYSGYADDNGLDPPRLDVFLTNTSGSLSHWYSGEGYTTTWEEWTAGSRTITGTPAAVAMGDNRFMVAALDTAGDLLTWTYDWGTLTQGRVSWPVGRAVS